jgi:phage-related protein
VAWENDNFILLHQFMKQTQKTPKKELDIAKRRYEEIKNGGDNIG